MPTIINESELISPIYFISLEFLSLYLQKQKTKANNIKSDSK